MENNLEQLGLSNTESKIYLKLLKIGESTAVQLAKEIKIHRRTIYDNLNILIKKGFVNYKNKDKVKYFSANDPKTFKLLLEEKNKIFENILPILSQFYSNQQKTPEISILSGLEGGKVILQEMLESKTIIYWMGGGLKILDLLGYSKAFIIKKLKKLKIKLIQPNIKEDFVIFPKKNIKILPQKYESNISFFIYDNTVVLGLIQNEDITIIKIKSNDFVKGYKNYFKLIWDRKNVIG